MQTYTLNEFTTGEWSDRPEYASDDPDFDHIIAVHREVSGLIEFGQCGDSRFWFFLHQRTKVQFDFYLYLTNTWKSIGGPPLNAEPFMWVYGTTFDGVRECSGGQNFTGDLLEMSNVLEWLHVDCCRRWPQFAEWYAK